GTCRAILPSSTSSTPFWWPWPRRIAGRGRTARAARSPSTSEAGDLAYEPREAHGRIRRSQGARPRAHGGQLGAVRQEAREDVHEALRREFGLGEDDGATGGLHKPGVGRLLIAARARQGHEHGGEPASTAHGYRAPPAPAYEERGRGVDIRELGADVRPQGVARAQPGREAPRPLLKPAVIARLRVVSALVEDLAELEEARQRLARDP